MGADRTREIQAREEIILLANAAKIKDRAEARKRIDALLARVRELEAALADLHAEVEMAESIGICLPDRVASLRASAALSGGSPANEEGGR